MWTEVKDSEQNIPTKIVISLFLFIFLFFKVILISVTCLPGLFDLLVWGFFFELPKNDYIQPVQKMIRFTSEFSEWLPTVMYFPD